MLAEYLLALWMQCLTSPVDKFKIGSIKSSIFGQVDINIFKAMDCVVKTGNDKNPMPLATRSNA